MIKYVPYVISSACTIRLINDYFMEVCSCTGPSMLPTVFEGDYLLLKKLQSKNTISRGNIVVCKSPHDPRVSVCKRVIGLEGDIINTRTEHGTFSYQLRIPKGHVWVEGDNTGESIDSRTYGPMPKGMVDGKVVLRVFPSIGRLP